MPSSAPTPNFFPSDDQASDEKEPEGLFNVIRLSPVIMLQSSTPFSLEVAAIVLLSDDHAKLL